LVAVTTGCAPEEKPAAGTSDRHAHKERPAEVNSGVLVLQRVPNVDIWVKPDRLVLDATDADDVRAASPGDVLVCGNGGGFLRRVVSMHEENGQLVVMTEHAPLTAAVASGGLHHGLALPLAKSIDVSGPEGDGVAVGLENTTLVGDGRVTVTIPEGHFRFDPGFDLDIDIDGGALQSFQAIAKGDIDAGFTLEVTLEGASGKALFDKELWSHDYPFFEMVGVVPVAGVVELSVGVGAEVDGEGDGTLVTGGSIQAGMKAGAFYDGEWHRVGEHYVWLTPVATSFDGEGGVSVTAYAYVEVAVKLYDVAGPALSVGPYVALTKESGAPIYPTIGFFGIFEAQVDLPFVDDAWVGYSATLFDVSRSFEADDTEPEGEDGATGDQCGGVLYLGYCDAGSAVWCDGGMLRATDCAAAGYGCGWIDDTVGAYCEEGCGELDYVGGCNGDSLRWCEDGAVITYDCASAELGCGFDGTLYNCL
jgi:hypothetical protein